MNGATVTEINSSDGLDVAEEGEVPEVEAVEADEVEEDVEGLRECNTGIAVTGGRLEVGSSLVLGPLAPSGVGVGVDGEDGEDVELEEGGGRTGGVCLSVIMFYL